MITLKYQLVGIQCNNWNNMFSGRNVAHKQNIINVIIKPLVSSLYSEYKINAHTHTHIYR